MFKFNFFRFLFILSLVFSLTFAAFADTIRLKDGSIIKGRIVGFNGGRFTVVVGDDNKQRQMNFTADEIESIVFDSGSSTVQAANTSNQTSSKPTNNNIDKTVIQVGQTPKATDVQNNQNKNSPTTSPSPDTSATNNPVSKLKPIELNVKVLADNTSNGWTNSGWVVRKGQKIRITAKGQISLGNGRTSNPGGISTLADNDKLRKDSPTGGLIAVVGDDNNDFIFIGQSLEFVATRDGALFLGVNEGNLNDNSGTFETKIEIEIDPN
jgi:hypothetical protein